MAALSAAKVAFDANDLNAAKEQLQWVVDHGRDEDYKALARIRLAGILLDQKAYDDGLKVLAADLPAPFASAAADRKGDILVAQNKLDEARAAYQLALDKMDSKNPGKELIQLKLDAIGGAPAKAAA
jgi:predicted negative regulator of RcsB-dependent stress response